MASGKRARTRKEQEQQQPDAAGAVDVVDAYGFVLQALSPAAVAERAACAAHEARRAAKWQAFADRQELPTGATLKRYCRKGVPHELRGWVWWHVSGAGETAAAAAPQHYEACLAAGSRQAAVKQIELDLPRTFPRHPWLAEPEGQEALRAVLTAYAGHNAGVGYCQGMNFLAGLLLLAVDHDAYRCFWLLVVLLEQVLYPGTYAANLDGCHVEMRCLGSLLAAKQPRLAAHLASLGCEASLLTTDWFLCLFATALPAESCARVWDALFAEGRKVLHRVALALLGAASPRLLAVDNPGEALRCLKAFAGGVHQRDQLMHSAFKGVGGLPRARLARMAAAEATRVDAMLAARSSASRPAAAAAAGGRSLKDSIAAGHALQQQAAAAAAAADSQQQGEQQQQLLLGVPPPPPLPPPQQQQLQASSTAAADLSSSSAGHQQQQPNSSSSSSRTSRGPAAAEGTEQQQQLAPAPPTSARTRRAPVSVVQPAVTAS